MVKYFSFLSQIIFGMSKMEISFIQKLLEASNQEVKRIHQKLPLHLCGCEGGCGCGCYCACECGGGCSSTYEFDLNGSGISRVSQYLEKYKIT